MDRYQNGPLPGVNANVHKPCGPKKNWSLTVPELGGGGIENKKLAVGK